jgi:hypothetical protein
VNETIRLRVGERIQNHGLEDAEDRDVRPDGDGECGDHENHENGPRQYLSYRKAEVLSQPIEKQA